MYTIRRLRHLADEGWTTAPPAPRSRRWCSSGVTPTSKVGREPSYAKAGMPVPAAAIPTSLRWLPPSAPHLGRPRISKPRSTSSTARATADGSTRPGWVRLRARRGQLAGLLHRATVGRPTGEFDADGNPMYAAVTSGRTAAIGGPRREEHLGASGHSWSLGLRHVVSGGDFVRHEASGGHVGTRVSGFRARTRMLRRGVKRSA